jgi:hypothetical protein
VFVLFCELFGNPSCTHLNSIQDGCGWFHGRTVTDLQKVCHFINSHHQLSTIMAQNRSVFSSVVDMYRHLVCSSSVTLVWPFLNVASHTYHTAVKHSSHTVLSLWLISAPGTPSVHKNRITAHCSSLVRMGREAPCWYCYNNTTDRSRSKLLHNESMLVATLAMSGADNATKC